MYIKIQQLSMPDRVTCKVHLQSLVREDICKACLASSATAWKKCPLSKIKAFRMLSSNKFMTINTSTISEITAGIPNIQRKLSAIPTSPWNEVMVQIQQSYYHDHHCYHSNSCLIPHQVSFKQSFIFFHILTLSSKCTLSFLTSKLSLPHSFYILWRHHAHRLQCDQHLLELYKATALINISKVFLVPCLILKINSYFQELFLKNTHFNIVFKVSSCNS